MRLLFIAILIHSTFLSFGQKLEIRVDDFKKDTTYQFSTVQIAAKKEFSGASFLEASISYSQGFYFLTLIPEYRSVQSLDEDDEVLIMFENGEILELKIKRSSISDYKSGKMFSQGSATTIWYNVISFYLTPENVMAFERQPIKKIRCGINDYTTKPKTSKTLMTMLRKIKQAIH